MCSLDDPSSTAVPGDLLLAVCFFAACLDVGGVSPVADYLPNIRVVVAFIHANVLRLLGSGLGTFDCQGFQRRLDEPFIMRVGAGDRHTQRDSGAIGKHASLGSSFGPIRWIWPSIFPPQVATWSSPHPSIETPSQSL